MSFTLRDAVTFVCTLVGMALVVAAWVAIFAGIGVVLGP